MIKRRLMGGFRKVHVNLQDDTAWCGECKARNIKDMRINMFVGLLRKLKTSTCCF